MSRIDGKKTTQQHKIRLHGRRGKGKAESFSREKLRQSPHKEGGEILCDLPPVRPRLVRPTSLTSRINGKKTHTHTEDCLMCRPTDEVIKSDTKKNSSSYYTIGGLHEDKLCDILQVMTPTNVQTVHQTSLLHIESNLDRLDCCRLPTASVLSNKADKSRSNQF